MSSQGCGWQVSKELEIAHPEITDELAVMNASRRCERVSGRREVD